MKMGVVFPQTEFPPDPIAIRDYAQTVEGLGFTHLLVYEHVLGANPERPGGWQGPYTHQHPFYEPFVLFSYLAALTQRLEFVTGILILPQRQTALVAKQAATLDVLCGGRLRLGIGIGWNAVEYTALGENFRNRGRRIEEQVALLRQLWTQPLVNFEGKWHQVPDAGLNPLPVQQPIPLWFGGQAEEVLRRTARLGRRLDAQLPPGGAGSPGAGSAAAQPGGIRPRPGELWPGAAAELQHWWPGGVDGDDPGVAGGRGDTYVGEHDGLRIQHPCGAPGGAAEVRPGVHNWVKIG